MPSFPALFCKFAQKLILIYHVVSNRSRCFLGAGISFMSGCRSPASDTPWILVPLCTDHPAPTTMWRSRRFVFSTINSTFFGGRSSFYASQVDNLVAGARVLLCLCPYPFHQYRTDLLPKPTSDRGVINVGGCCIWRKIMGRIAR